MKRIIVMVVIALASLNVQAQNEKNLVYDANATIRSIKNFNAIEVSGAIDIYLSQGNEEAVAVSASSPEMASRIKTVVKGGVLEIYFESGGWGWKTWGNTKMKAYITFKNLDNIQASGACNIKAAQSIKSKNLRIEMSGASDFSGEVSATNLKLDASGASNIKISGNTETTAIDASGACNISGYNLKTNYCVASASGASNIHIRVAKELTADASGGSCIFYKGAGVIKSIDTSGGASVKKKADND